MAEERAPDPDPAAEGIPEPPWLASRPRRARPPIDRDAIVDATLRVLERDDAAGLSMRRIADELGAGVGAIYWHVANKEQLIQLVFERVIGDLPLPEPDPKHWQEQIKQAARDARELMRRHPGLARLSFGRVPLGPNAIRYFEWHLSILRAGGLPDRVAALAGDLIHLYVYAFAHEESLGMSTPAGPTATVDDFIEQIHTYLSSLPPEAFPNTTALAEEITRPGLDERFEFGLTVLVSGLAAQRDA